MCHKNHRNVKKSQEIVGCAQYKGNSLSEDYTHKLQEEIQSLIRELSGIRKTTTHLQEEIQREKLKETLLQDTGIYTGE
jgi:hypothetical protein